jgi:hypothetical protein
MDCVLKAMDMATLSITLKPFSTKDVVLCTDGSKAFAGTARKLGIEHHAVNLSAGIRVDGAWHVQNVNAYHSQAQSLGTKVSRCGHVLFGQLSRLVSCTRP